MNRNEYRRALIMLRSLRTGVSGYVRLERRTLMGTLQFTVNGADNAGDMHAVLLYRNHGGFSAVNIGQFAAPRYGQTGLVWKFDPRNIEGRTLEQYDLAAVIDIENGICELLLCGNLNGSVEADWIQVREAACRLFSPVRISGAPIAPIDEKGKCSCDSSDDNLQTLPEYGEETPAYPGNDESTPMQPRIEEEDYASEESEMPVGEEREPTSPPSVSDEADENSDASVNSDVQESDSSEESAQNCCSIQGDDAALRPEAPSDHAAHNVETGADDFDIPATDDVFMTAARAALSVSTYPSTPEPAIEPDELDIPAQDDFGSETTAGNLLELSDPNAEWPASIEPLRTLFFSSEAIVPFETDGFIFIRAPLPAESGVGSCLIGLYCENGVPDRICYAIPSPYSSEPPVGLEGYVWRGDRTRGYWVICEGISD